MRRLIGKLILLTVAFVAMVVALHVLEVIRYEGRIEAAYNLPSGRSVLFIGASQVVCAIEERESLSNVVVAVSGTACQLYLLHLKELEKRGKLEGIKICCVPFNRYNMLEQRKFHLNSSWYTALPLTWRYWRDTPTGVFDFCWYAANSLKFPFKFSVAKSPYPRRTPFPQRSKENLKECGFYGMIEENAKEYDFSQGMTSGWQETMISVYAEMKAICDRHQIKFIVFSMPMLRCYQDLMPKSSQEVYEELKTGLESREISFVEIGDRPDDYFYDHIHLSESGQKRFTDELMERLR